MKTTFYISLIVALMSSSLYTKQGLFAQNVGINGTGATAHPSALLDLDASASPSVGLLVPRISLSLTTLPAPVTGPANSLMVYNLATTTGTAGVSPGYYYWDATALKWIRIQTSATTANDWNLLGNAGTTPGINFLGTTDAKDVVFKRNNVKAGLLNGPLLNTSWGVEALNFVTTGSGNTAIGGLALDSTTTGNSNSALGWAALQNNKSGSGNTAIGVAALNANKTADNNTAIGTRALAVNTTGSYNVASGANCLTSNTTGNNNTASGYQSLQANTTGSMNVANGYRALFLNTTGSLNIATGLEALFSNTTGNQNTANGSNALHSNTIGSSNVANGVSALSSNTTGENNAVNGSYGLYFNTTGNFNVANGTAALWSNTTASENTANGYSALHENTTAEKNTAIGCVALYSTTTGSNNVALGAQAGLSNTVGSNNTFIGTYTGPVSNNLTNATAIGFNAAVGQSNALILGGTGTYAVNVGMGIITPSQPLHMGSGAFCTAAGVWTNASDSRLKDNIKSSAYGLTEVMKLKPVTYTMKANGEKQIGFIAQEVKTIIPEVVSGKEGDVTKGETLGLSYGNMVALLTKAIQEQQAQIELLTKKVKQVDEQQQQNEAQQKQLTIQQEQIDTLKQLLQKQKGGRR